ncbi:MAG: ABC transporter substrate-binding protein [Bacillota bacterium]|nr:ABC transporter substrate-binding protein [Bacillota bacterium]
MKRIIIKYVIAMLAILPLVSCSLTGSYSDDDNNSKSESIGDKKSEATDISKNKQDPNEITIWGYQQGWENYKADFEKAHPGIKLKFVPVDLDLSGNITSKLLDQMAEGAAPDIINIQFNWLMGQYNYIDGLADLYQPPFNAKSIIDKIPKNQSCWTTTTDGKKLLAIPLVPRARVTYFREDIMKKYGFPSDPVELGEYIQKPDNWLKIARELKKHNIWIMQWAVDPLDIYINNTGFYDNKMNFIRNTNRIAEMLYTIRMINAEELASYVGIWEPKGQKTIKDGRMAMVYMGDYGESNLEAWAPETSGKWRATRLPFGAYNPDGWNALAISKSSKHKELAWELVKKIYEDDRKLYTDILNEKSNFLGGQKAQKLYADLRSKIPEYYFTPFEKKMKDLWDTEVLNYSGYTYREKDDFKAVKDIENKFSDVFGNDLSILSKYLGVKNRFKG